jgi:hypothetical protein
MQGAGDYAKGGRRGEGKEDSGGERKEGGGVM